MLQIDHVYEFFYKTIFKIEFELLYCNDGVISTAPSIDNITVFNGNKLLSKKIFFYDQEPLLAGISNLYLDFFDHLSFEDSVFLTNKQGTRFENLLIEIPADQVDLIKLHLPNRSKITKIFVTSEISQLSKSYRQIYDLHHLYYFFHGFAALDWYRGFYALNYNKQVNKEYKYDYITFNRLVSNDRSYRCYFVSRLAEKLLLEHGQVSFGLSTEQPNWQEEITDINTKLSNTAIDHIKLHLPSTPLIIDNERVLGSASADIPRCTNDSFWHIVTETVFYYDKLHLTEKIFKPIVMKQPFMLLAAPGNLAYLKSYGFKTFEGIINENYDTIEDPDDRVDAVVQQLDWYCALTAAEKQEIIRKIEPIVEYNFHHFYGEFKHIITRELLDNCRTLFNEIGYNDSHMDYTSIHHVLAN